MDRRYWIGLLIVIALGAVIFALAQNQTLNQTQSTLVAAQNTVTAQSNQLNGQATSAVETLVAVGTQAADDQQKAVKDAQSAAATALSAAVSNQQHTAATAQAQAVSDAQNAAATTQAALEQQSQDAASTAQANADEQATAVAGAQNDLATSQANAQNIAATAQAAQNAVETQAALAATAQAQAFSDAQTPFLATIAALQSQLDAASTQAASGGAQSAPTEVAAGDVTPAAGWNRLVGRGVAIQLPDSFNPVDLTSSNTSALSDMLSNLGPEFASAAAMIQQNPDLFVFMAFDNRSKSGLVSNVLILAQDLPFELPLKSLVDATIAQLPASIHVTENDVVEVGSRQAGRIVTDNTLTTPASKQVEYFFIESGRVYIVVFTTTVDEFETRLPVFEQAAASLEFNPGS